MAFWRDRYGLRRAAFAAVAAVLLLGPISPAAASQVGAGPVAAAPSTAASVAVHAASIPTDPYANPSPYYLADAGGAVWPLGGATDYGSMLDQPLNAPIIGITLAPDHGGYWLVAGDGGIFSFGDARFYGSTGNLRLNAPVIGMAATPDGGGYWLYAGDGGIFSFGDARFYGSTGNLRLNQPIVGMAATPDQRGYWLVARDGGVFTFGDAGFAGSLGGQPLGQSVAAILSAPGGGYWLEVHDGDLYPFGSAVGTRPPVLAMMHTVEGPGDVAMEWAMAQLGKPYQWGGTGPDSFDCSGLVLRAWQAAGVDLPRVAAEQYAAAPHVPMDQLLDGDLVFWASNPADPTTIEHVALYIGGGHMVNAPYPGQVVSTGWINGPGFVLLATRP